MGKIMEMSKNSFLKLSTIKNFFDLGPRNHRIIAKKDLFCSKKYSTPSLMSIGHHLEILVNGVFLKYF